MLIMIHSLFNDAPISEYLYIHQIGTENFERFEMREHIFECMTVHFVVSGRGYFNGECVQAGQGFSVNKNELAVYGPDPEDPWVYYWINFEGIAAIDVFKQLGWDAQPGVFTCPSAAQIRTLLDGVIHGDFSGRDTDSMLKSVWFECFSYLIAEYRSRHSAGGTPQEAHVTRALAYIKNHFTQKISIEQLARRENISRIYMSSLFKKYTGRSPQEHMMRMRIEKAKSLLLTTVIPISSIAVSVGYEDVLQFSKIFRKHTGVAPSAFRGGEEDLLRIYE